MCSSRNSKRTPFKKGEETEWKKVDKCLSNLLCFINGNTTFRTLGSCCGHCKYPMTIVCRSPFGFNIEICSGKTIPRKKRFYKKDKEGFYYIPEVSGGINMEKELEDIPTEELQIQKDELYSEIDDQYVTDLITKIVEVELELEKRSNV